MTYQPPTGASSDEATVLYRPIEDVREITLCLLHLHCTLHCDAAYRRIVVYCESARCILNITTSTLVLKIYVL